MLAKPGLVDILTRSLSPPRTRKYMMSLSSEVGDGAHRDGEGREPPEARAGAFTAVMALANIIGSHEKRSHRALHPRASAGQQQHQPPPFACLSK